jgi:hypothetical protein
MNFMRVWVCSRGHEAAYIRSSERRPLCPVCDEVMSKSRSDGMPALFMAQETEVEIVDEEAEVGTPDIDGIEDGIEPIKEEPLERLTVPLDKIVQKAPQKPGATVAEKAKKWNKNANKKKESRL